MSLAFSTGKDGLFEAASVLVPRAIPLGRCIKDGCHGIQVCALAGSIQNE
jgi:hypothetical protein